MSIHWQSLTKEGRIMAIKGVYRRGMTASKIAKQFENVSRDAVLGMFHRYPVELAECELPPPRCHYLEPPPKMVRPKSASKPAALVKPTAESSVGRPLYLLEQYECRWPVNDADVGETHLFCGAHTERVYCERHAQLAYKAQP